MGSDKRWEERLALLQTFQSTLPAGGATGVREVSGDSDFISIHAPRRGSDFGFLRVVNMAINFNPRSPQGERLDSLPTLSAQFIISIHAPRRGSDINSNEDVLAIFQFQSTLPAGGATG